MGEGYPKALLQRAYKTHPTDGGFEEWCDENVVEYSCMDCGEQVVRGRLEWLDVDGLTPKRCGSCTLDRMAESD